MKFWTLPLSVGKKKTTFRGLNLTPSTDKWREERTYSGAAFKFVYRKRLPFITGYSNTVIHTTVTYIIERVITTQVITAART
jgi:hypothetical protein